MKTQHSDYMNRSKARIRRARWLLCVGVTMIVTALIALAQHNEDPDELLRNPSFESPTIQPGYSLLKPRDWNVFSSRGADDEIGMSTELVHSGNQAVHIAAQDVPGSFQGLAQVVAVQPRNHYEFTVHVHNDPKQPMSGSVRAQMGIEWRNERGEEIERSRGPQWSRRELRRFRWESFTMQDRAPRDAATAAFTITQFDESRPMEGGAFYLDDASVKRVP